MKKLTLLLIATFIAGALALGCQSKSFKEPGTAKQPTKKTDRIFFFNFEKTWEAVSEAVGKYPVLTTRKESGLIITDWIKGKSDTLYSGYGETRIPYTIRYKLRLRVKPSGKGTVVDVESKEQYLTDAVTSGIDFSGSLYQWLDTRTSTLKEAALLDEIAEILSTKK